MRHLIALHFYKELFERCEHPPPQQYSTVSPTQAASCLLIAVIVTQGEHWETTQLCCFCRLLQRKTNLACFLMMSLIVSASKQSLTSFDTCLECWFLGYTSAKANSFRGDRWGSHAWMLPSSARLDLTSLMLQARNLYLFFFLFPTSTLWKPSCSSGTENNSYLH